ncbi:hypothetical protein BDA99DRAFT_495319, partial [Phascolomyces articulosus]
MRNERNAGHAHTLRTRAKQDERVRLSVRYGSSFLLVDPFWQNHLWVGFLKLPRAQLQVINGSMPLWFKPLLVQGTFWLIHSGRTICG